MSSLAEGGPKMPSVVWRSAAWARKRAPDRRSGALSRRMGGLLGRPSSEVGRGDRQVIRDGLDDHLPFAGREGVDEAAVVIDDLLAGGQHDLQTVDAGQGLRRQDG